MCETLKMIRKSHARKIYEWYEEYRTPPAHAIGEERDHFVGAWITPFYHFPYRNPSQETCLEILSAFSLMYDDWDKAFAESGQPYDLQLWIYDLHFLDCQLVCSPVDQTGDIRDNYFHPCPEQYLFPSEKYSKYLHFDPEEFHWTTFEARSYLFEKMNNLNEKRIKRFLNQGWREDNALLQGRERAFWNIYDFVWVGRKFRV